MCVCESVCVSVCMYICMCVCVCERETETEKKRERERGGEMIAYFKWLVGGQYVEGEKIVPLVL